MPHPLASSLAALVLTTASVFAAPRVVPPRPINLDPSGPSLPTQAPAEAPHPAAIPLWSRGAPGTEARRGEPEEISWRQEPELVFPVISNIHNPSLTPYLPDPPKATGCAVIIAPGGGHMQHTIDREGYDLARWLADQGIAAFVLKYRLARDGSTPAGQTQAYTVDRDAWADGARAVRLIRSRAVEWGIDPARVGFLGFSAGGEVALLVAGKHDAGSPDAADAVERESSRPDFFAPIYPGGLQRTDLAVSRKETPPAFLSCAYDDTMAERLAGYFVRLRSAGVNAEIHIYGRGGHGYGVRADRPELAVSAWQSRFVDWLRDLGMLRP
jgi:acetyl esterase/lipase